MSIVWQNANIVVNPELAQDSAGVNFLFNTRVQDIEWVKNVFDIAIKSQNISALALARKHRQESAFSGFPTSITLAIFD